MICCKQPHFMFRLLTLLLFSFKTSSQHILNSHLATTILVILRMLVADFLLFSSILSAACCQKATVPKNLIATSGSCLLIPCVFTISKDKEALLDSSSVVTWRRGSLWSLYGTDHFNQTHRQMEPLVKVVGDLQMKNCTSVMMNLTSQHSDRYYFNFQTQGSSVTETKAVQIHVSDSLAEPHVNVPVLREGEVGNLTCTVPVPCPGNYPNVTWDPAFDGNITQWTQLNPDGTQSVSAILNFVPLFHHHELNVSCVSIHLLNRQDKPMHSHKTVILNVEYPPKETRVSLTGSVGLGNKLNLTCQSNANPPTDHRWFLKKDGRVEEVGASRVLSFIMTHENTGEYTCEAQNVHGAVNSTILQINVSDIPFIVFPAVLTPLSLLIFAISILLICKRCKNTQRSETNQDQDIYANVSASAEKSHQFQSKTCGDEDINPTFNKNLSCEDIYANC